MSLAPAPAVQRMSAARDRLAGVRGWLWLVIALTFLMITIGGATRLTGSGLSITEWRPVTGAIPPLDASDWLAEFERYRQSSQYELLNKGMTLEEFKFIYWWEWGHRQLGRLIGLVYLGGFLWVAARRLVTARTTALLFGMGLLLGLQGAVGWIMVASGLEPGMIAVAPVKLTLHLMFASLFLASVVAMVVAMTPPRSGEERAAPNIRGAVWLYLILLALQIALGGLVAGSRAGFIYNTWPLMDGRFFPPLDSLFSGPNGLRGFVENQLAVQFSHRMLAYVLTFAAIGHAIGMGRLRLHSAFVARARALAGLVVAQAIVGIVTLMLAVPVEFGLAHQALAMAILAMLVIHLTRAHGWRVAPRLA